MQHLARLEYPIVCDLLRAVSPIPAAEIPAALLSETDEAYTIALEVLDQDKRQYLAEGIESIAERITDHQVLFRIDRKLAILNKVNARVARSLGDSDAQPKIGLTANTKIDKHAAKTKQTEPEAN